MLNSIPKQQRKQPQQDLEIPPAYAYAQDDEINLLDLWKVLVDYKTLILIVTALATIIALLTALFMPPVYRAEVLLAPATQEDGSRFSAMASQFGGLASLAGIDVGGGGSSLDEAIALLNSREFTNKFIRDEKLLSVLFEQEWDADNKQWQDKVPTEWEAYKLFDAIRMINVDRKTGLIILAIEWKAPEQAADWANKLVQRINIKLRNEAILKSEKSIQYLNNELKRTSVIEVKQSIYKLIEAQTKNKMLANTQHEYAFRVLDPAVAAEEKIKPQRKLIVVLGFILGAMLSVFLAFFLKFIKNQREKMTLQQ